MTPKEKFSAMADVMRSLSRRKILVGWVQPSKNEPGTSMSMGKLARILCTGWESGTSKDGRSYPRLPARNFMKVTRSFYGHDVDKVCRKTISKIVSGKMTEAQGLSWMAEYWKGKMQDAMGKSSEYEPLSPATIKARKSAHRSVPAMFLSKPLIDTGTLRNSITYEVK